MGVFIKVSMQAFQGDGSSFMWAIILSAAVAAALLIERALFLFVRCGVKGNKKYSELISTIDEKGIEEGISSIQNSKSPIDVILTNVLEYRDMGVKYVQRKINISFLTELPKIQKNVGMLNMVANIATLLGLLGTIVGLIMAFDAVANVEASKRAEALAMGISIAMVTTAFGLMIAIPTLFFHGMVVAQSERVVELMDEKSTKLMNKLFNQ